MQILARVGASVSITKQNSHVSNLVTIHHRKASQVDPSSFCWLLAGTSSRERTAMCFSLLQTDPLDHVCETLPTACFARLLRLSSFASTWSSSLPCSCLPRIHLGQSAFLRTNDLHTCCHSTKPGCQTLPKSKFQALNLE